MIKENSKLEESTSNQMEFKILVIGQKGVGKATFFQRHSKQKFDSTPTQGGPLTFQTNRGIITLNLTLSTTHRNGFDGEIVVLDKSQRQTMQILHNLPNFTGPRVVIMTKEDVKSERDGDRISMQDQINLYSFGMYMEVSPRSKPSYDTPMVHLMRKLTGHNDLQIMGRPVYL